VSEQTLEREGAATARAQARFVHVTPMKARRVVDLVRGMQADRALAILRFAPQSASEPVYKVLASAVANAAHARPRPRSCGDALVAPRAPRREADPESPDHHARGLIDLRRLRTGRDASR
jgi:hypothetical protein